MNDRGFTLVELLITISILGTLAAVVMISLGSARDKSEETKATRQVQEIHKAIASQRLDTGVYPNGVGDACGNGNETVITLGHVGSEMHEIPLDPWGNPYYWDSDYQCLDGTTGCAEGVDDGSELHAVIVSCGPNMATSATACVYDRDNIVDIVCSR